MMNSQYNEYISFLTIYRDELLATLKNEREKRQALLDNNIGRVEAMIQVQQAVTMKLRGYETKRIALQSKLGLPDVRAKELLSAISDQDAQKSIDALFTEIADIAEEVREQNKQSLELANTNLKILELILQGGVVDEHNSLYGPENSRRNTFSTGNTLEETI